MLQECLEKKKEDKANAYFSMLVYATMLGGIFLSVLGAILIPSICSLLGAKGALLSDCVLYARLSFISLPAFMLQNVFQSFFVTAEKPHLGLYVIIAAGMTNMVLDFFICWGLGIWTCGCCDCNGMWRIDWRAFSGNLFFQKEFQLASSW